MNPRGCPGLGPSESCCPYRPLLQKGRGSKEGLAVLALALWMGSPRGSRWELGEGLGSMARKALGKEAASVSAVFGGGPLGAVQGHTLPLTRLPG